MEEIVKIATMEHGIMGSGVAKVLSNHTENIAKWAGEEIRIKYILDLGEFPRDPLVDHFTKPFDDALDDPKVKIVVEVVGGLHPACESVRSCPLAGESVTTSSKKLVAAKDADFLALAQKRNLNFLFGASVGGGTPIIRPMSQCPAANGVTEINGILNGTTNLILTKMIHDQMDSDDALALAQKLGYAEHNPTADVEGMDACRKICILASLVLGKHVHPDQVHTEGITKIALVDVEYAKVWGDVIKLIGRVKILENDQTHIMIRPMFVPHSNQLTAMDDAFNGIQARDDSIGDMVLYGRGAGKLPTANAVVADVIDYVRYFKVRKYLPWDQAVPDYMCSYHKDTITFYACAKSEDSAFALGQAGGPFGPVRQPVHKGMDKDEFAFVTEPLVEEDFLGKLERPKKEGTRMLSTLHVSGF